MASVIEIAQKRVEYVHLMSQCGFAAGSPRHQQLLSDCVGGVLKAVQGKKFLTPSDVVAVKGMVEGLLPEPMVQTLVTAMDAKVNSPKYKNPKHKHEQHKKHNITQKSKMYNL
jgi:hypothetical protein